MLLGTLDELLVDCRDYVSEEDDYGLVAVV